MSSFLGIHTQPPAGSRRIDALDFNQLATPAFPFHYAHARHRHLQRPRQKAPHFHVRLSIHRRRGNAQLDGVAVLAGHLSAGCARLHVDVYANRAAALID